MSKEIFLNQRSEVYIQKLKVMRSNDCYDPIKSIPNL